MAWTGDTEDRALLSFSAILLLPFLQLLKEKVLRDGWFRTPVVLLPWQHKGSTGRALVWSRRKAS